MNAFTFDTLAAYLSAKSSGGAIYTALSAGGNSPVSASVVSYITGTGETYIDSKNPIVDAPYGEVGDTLLYKGGKYYWLKTRVGYNPAGYGGAFMHEAALTAGGYTQVGILFFRNGKRGLIMAHSMYSQLQYKTSATADTGIAEHPTVRIRKGSDLSYCIGSLTRAQAYYGSTYQMYLNPFPKSAWDAMMTQLNSGAAGSNSESGHWSWSVASSNSVLKASFSLLEGIGGTYNPADYDNDWNVWRRRILMAQVPTSVGACSDLDGQKNTKILYGSDSGATHPAAKACYEHAVSGVSDYAAGKWWLPACGEAVYMMLNYDKLKAKGHDMYALYPGAPYFWTSTQYSSSYARYLYFGDGDVTYYSKTLTTIRARAVSAFNF